MVQSGFFAGWTTPFAVLLGAFVLTLFALLAALYLCADGPSDLAHVFRRWALATELAAGALSMLVLWRAAADAPALWLRMLSAPSFWPVQVATAVVAVAVLATLWRRRYAVARVLGAGQVVLVVAAWGLAMDGDIVLGAVRVGGAGTRPETTSAVLPALGIGFALCVPSLVYLFRVFRRVVASERTGRPPAPRQEVQPPAASQ